MLFASTQVTVVGDLQSTTATLTTTVVRDHIRLSTLPRQTHAYLKQNTPLMPEALQAQVAVTGNSPGCS